MKIAVTGATGFIGRHVVAELIRQAVNVVCVSRHLTPALGATAAIETVQQDIADAPEDVFARLGKPDALIHLAWGGLPNYRALHHFEHELPIHYRFLSRMVRGGLSAMVVAGTCFEYGMQSGELTESADARPDNPYGFAKVALLQQLEFLRTNCPFALAWARLFYLYGDGQAQNSLLPQLRRAVERGDAVFNMSGGEQLRDYLPVANIARHLVMLATNKMDPGVVNISSGNPVSVRNFIENTLAEHQWKIQLNLGHYPYPDYEPLAFWGCRERLDALIGCAGNRSACESLTTAWRLHR